MRLSSLPVQRQMLLASLAISGLTLAATFMPTPSTSSLMFGPNAAAAITTSHNWSGYTATCGTFTTVAGTWTIPQVSSSGYAAADATWVGIGGITRRDLIQGGTQNIVSSSGQISTTAFIEMLPRASQQIPMTINPGDSVNVSVAQQSTNQWQLSFTDTTNGQTYSTVVTYPSSLSSAEWIEEDPSARARLLPLDNFGTVQISGGTTTQNGNAATIAQASGQAMSMLDANCQALATVSALGSDGASFTVTRSSTSTAPVSEQPGGERGWRRDGYGIGQYPGGIRDCSSGAPVSIPNPEIVPWWIQRPATNLWGRWFPFPRR